MISNVDNSLVASRCKVREDKVPKGSLSRWPHCTAIGVLASGNGKRPGGGT